MKISKDQMQKTVLVQLLDGSQKDATATGNNAAWLCRCGWHRPLLGRTGKMKISKGYIVECPCCERAYFVVPDGRDCGRVLKVEEIRL